MHPPEKPGERLILTVILGGGIVAGLVSTTLATLILLSVALGVFLNAYLLGRSALQARAYSKLPLAAIGAIPAGVFDAVKILVVGLPAWWAVPSFRASPGQALTACAFLGGLGVLTFIYVFNLHLRGMYTKLAEMVLALGLILLIVASFVVANWKVGIMMLALLFPLTWFWRPPAAALAQRLLGYRTGIHEDTSFSDATAGLGTDKLSPPEFLRKLGAKRDELRKRLATLSRRPEIAAVLSRHGVSLDRFQELYNYLGLCALDDLAWNILGDPSELDRLIVLSGQDIHPGEVERAFREKR